MENSAKITKKTSVEAMLAFEPVMISHKKGEIMPTANLAKTSFINSYNGCGNGVAYITRKKRKIFLVAFNYGSSILLDNYEYARVDFSSTQICFISGIEKSLNQNLKEKQVISKFVHSLKTVSIFGKDFLCCKNYPSEISSFKKEASFGFVQKGSFVKRHKDNGYGPYVTFLPQQGAYEAYVFDRKQIDFTWGLGSENYNVIKVQTLYFYDGDKKYEVLVNPNAQEIEKKLNDCFDSIPQEVMSDNLKVRFVYKHNPLV